MLEPFHFQETKHFMKTRTIIEALFAFSLPITFTTFYYLAQTNALSERGGWGMLFLLLISALGLFYIPFVFINLYLYRKMHHRGVSIKTANSIYMYQMIYEVLNLMVTNVILGPIYIISYIKGSRITNYHTRRVNHEQQKQ